MNTKNRSNNNNAAVDALRSERNQLIQKVKKLESSLALATAGMQGADSRTGARRATPSMAGRCSHPLNRALITAAGFLLLSTATNLTAFQDVRSTINTPVPASTTTDFSDSLANRTRPESQPTLAPTGKETKNSKPSAHTSNSKRTRLAAVRPLQHRQWGPAVYLHDAQNAPRHYVFSPLIQQQQEDLLVLGFDIGKADGFAGPKTRRALQEFRSLYLSGIGLKREPDRRELATILGSYATLARTDAASFNVDQGVVAAIRLSSVRTGVEFPYLMELAAAESNFNPASQARNSSATGLYQFTRDTWLNTIRKHGAKYGLERYTSQIEFYIDRNGNQRPMVESDSVLEHLLELRKNPRVSAMMAAETVKDNQRLLSFSLNRKPERTDLYLMHFLGNAGAISFLKELDKNPGVAAVKLFPRAAKSNKNIFHPRSCGPRTLSDVYQLFEEKFNTSLYEER